MRKAAAIVLTTGLLLGTVAFGALAQGQNTGDERCQKPGKVSRCEQEKREAETAPWDKPPAGEQQKAEGCKCYCGGGAGDPAPAMKGVRRCVADEPGGREPGAERCGRDKERPGCGDRCGRDEAGMPPPPMKRVHCHGTADQRREGPGEGRCGRDGEQPGYGDGCRRDKDGNPPPPMRWEHHCMMEGGCHEGPGPEPMDREGKSSLKERQKAVDQKPSSKMKPVHTCERCGRTLEMTLDEGPRPQPEQKR